MKKLRFNLEDKNRIIQMAWQDRTTFEGIQKEFNLTENQLKNFMRTCISKHAYKRWRKRVQGRITKHEKKVDFKPIKFKGPW